MQNLSSVNIYFLHAVYALGSIYDKNLDADDMTRAGDLYYQLSANELTKCSPLAADEVIIGCYFLLFKYAKGGI